MDYYKKNHIAILIKCSPVIYKTNKKCRRVSTSPQIYEHRGKILIDITDQSNFAFLVYMYHKILLICERATAYKSIAPTFREKGSSSNEIIHFKVKGLRGDYQIVPN